jgi:large repetitive protein
MRKTTASLFAGVAAAILAGAGLGGTAFAASAPLVQECSPTINGGTLVNGVCVLPAAAVGQQYSEPFAYASGTGGSFSVTGTLPPGLSASGTTVAGSPTQQGTFTFTVTESAQAGPPLQEAYSITVGPPLPLTDTTAVSAGTVGTAYTAGFTLSGGEAPYTWSQVSGQLPPGLALASSGAPGQTDDELTGTPTTAGTYVFTMQVTDTLGDTASGQVSITINPRPPLKISEPSATAGPAGTVGTAYPGIGFAATGGQTPYTWTVATGQLPPGLALHTPSSYQRHTFPGADIILTGTPTTAGTFTFTIKVTDSLGDTATQSLSITIKA